ncbi:MAG: nucleoside triphosphate pyrophosphohydrolase [Rikenellaceae bacterium]|nr:nucleoside triphosphate pyrophosphohydrolase [Rikenellaceae bacterium]
MLERKKEAFGRLIEVLDELRVKCPWDREQTMQSLRNCTIEETFELTDAIADMDYDGIKQELGDLLLHVVFYSKIADEEGRFDISDVIDFLCDKLIYRHPHVFGDVDADNPEQVTFNWAQLKLKEKKRKKGILGGVPKSLPAMVKAYRIGEKAASAGFDWEKREDVWEKVREEMDETEKEIRSGDPARMQDEFGDLFFSLVNAARLYGVDPEMALERCNRKFIRRFNHVEEQAGLSGKPVNEYTIQQLEAWWREAKIKERDEK